MSRGFKSPSLFTKNKGFDNNSSIVDLVCQISAPSSLCSNLVHRLFRRPSLKSRHYGARGTSFGVAALLIPRKCTHSRHVHVWLMIGKFSLLAGNKTKAFELERITWDKMVASTLREVWHQFRLGRTNTYHTNKPYRFIMKIARAFAVTGYSSEESVVWYLSPARNWPIKSADEWCRETKCFLLEK